MMLEFLKKGLHLGIGAVSITRDKAEQLAQEMVKKGEITADEAKGLADQLVQRGEEERKNLRETVRHEFDKLRNEFKFVSKEEYERLEQRVKELEAKSAE